VSPSGPFTMDSWIAGLKAGRSFVTNYPLFTHFDVEGRTMGETLWTSKTTLQGSVWVKCAVPFTKIEIIGDTGVLRVLEPPAPAKSFATTFEIPRNGISWVVARATGPASTWHVIDANGLFAQTAPTYILDYPSAMFAEGAPQATGEPRIRGALYFLDRLRDLETEYAAHGYFPLPQSQQAFNAAVAQARTVYNAVLSISTGVTTPSLRTPWELKAVWPNPSGGAARVVYRVPHNGDSHDVEVYDAAGRAVRRLFSGTRPGGDYELEWDGRDGSGARVASGVYFVRIRAAGATQVARKLVLVR
jgi:FlgD Ig-like domain